MSTSRSDRKRCVKRGLIMMCYLDGRKRFRAVPVDQSRAQKEVVVAQKDCIRSQSESRP
ncbi:MAG: hypothetical protein ACE5EQ_08655 [Phycisphaerae bacterium]